MLPVHIYFSTNTVYIYRCTVINGIKWRWKLKLAVDCLTYIAQQILWHRFLDRPIKSKDKYNTWLDWFVKFKTCSDWFSCIRIVVHRSLTLVVTEFRPLSCTIEFCAVILCQFRGAHDILRKTKWYFRVISKRLNRTMLRRVKLPLRSKNEDRHSTSSWVSSQHEIHLTNLISCWIHTTLH